jgi:hypothetical protein
MSRRILSWPPSLGVGTRETSQIHNGSFTSAERLERCGLPREPARIHVLFQSRTRLCETDLEDQRFDLTMKAPSLTSTLSSHSFNINIQSTPVTPTSTNDMSQTRSRWTERRKSYHQWLRWTGFTVYRKLFGVVLIVNVAMIIWVITRQVANLLRADNSQQPRSLLSDTLTAVSANLMLAIAIRNEHVVNLLFRGAVVFTSTQLPLSVRRRLAKIYCFGGIHSGCGVAATCWYILFLGLSIFDYITYGEPLGSKPTLIVAFATLLLMVTIVAGAHPSVRNHLHDYFELSHRLGGWIALALFWAQMFGFSVENARQSSMSMGRTLVQTPTFWMLIAITGLIAYPWLRLQHVKVEVELLSHHAVRVYFQGEQMPACRTIRVSDSPLFETHSFATISEPDGKPGYSMVVSRAGDWTGRIIDNPPNVLWVKGVPAWGVLRIATMFKPVVIVATGSGIGPCLGLFNGFPKLPCRVLWSAKTPNETYGKDIVDTVRRADQDAVILDTKKIAGRPNMIDAARKLYQESNAEAIVIISNPKLTGQVVRTLECEGIPAFGPIWDS